MEMGELKLDNGLAELLCPTSLLPVPSECMVYYPQIPDFFADCLHPRLHVLYQWQVQWQMGLAQDLLLWHAKCCHSPMMQQPLLFPLSNDLAWHPLYISSVPVIPHQAAA